MWSNSIRKSIACAVRAAAEAVIKALSAGLTVNDGVFSSWNGQQALNSAGLFQLHAAADDLDNIGAIDQVADEILGYQSGHINFKRPLRGIGSQHALSPSRLAPGSRFKHSESR